jgi:hypothetical protein
LILVAGSWSAAAQQANTSDFSCDMVRAYVAQVGLIQAKMIALAHGMTAAQERRARQCLREERVSVR